MTGSGVRSTLARLVVWGGLSMRCDVRYLVAVGAIAGTLALAGCRARVARTQSGYRLANVAYYMQDPWWATLQCGATRQAERMGSKITWYSTATDTSSATQQANLNAALLSRPDAMLLASSHPGTFSSEVKRLMLSGTPVIAVNSVQTPANERVLFHNSEDNREFVLFVANQMQGQSGTYGVLGGTAGSPDGIPRWKPMVEQLKVVAPNLHALPTQFDEYNRTRASAAASAMIVAHPDLRFLYAITGPEGEGAAAAVQQSGKAKQIKVYSYGANESEVLGLKRGVYAALCGQPGYAIGEEGVKEAIAYLQSATKGAPVPQLSPVVHNIPLKVLTKENVDDASSAPYLQKSTCN